MNIEIVKNDKNDMELLVDNLTIAEVLRDYLNREGIEFAAWRREHPSKPVLFKIKNAGGVSKVVVAAIASIKKDAEKIVSSAKK